MKEYGIKILYGILAIGILISFFHIFNDKGGSGFRNVIDTLTTTSLILFLSSIVFILFSLDSPLSFIRKVISRLLPPLKLEMEE